MGNGMGCLFAFSSLYAPPAERPTAAVDEGRDGEQQGHRIPSSRRFGRRLSDSGGLAWQCGGGSGVSKLRVDDTIHVRLDLESTEKVVKKERISRIFLII